MKTLYLYFSDLHLEMRFDKREQYAFVFDEVQWYKKAYPNHRIHVLAAGDISKANKQYTYEFFDELCAMVDEVFYVFGNHEFYGGFINKEHKKFIEDYSQYKTNLHLMENDYLEFDNHVVIGATLWTSFNNGNSKASIEACANMNDYKYIRKGYGDKYPKIYPSDTSSRNFESEKFIFETIQNFRHNSDKTIIVMTHHAPYSENQICDLLDYAYYNEYYDNLVNRDTSPDFWVYGHTHEKFMSTVGGCKVLSNAIGYPVEVRFDGEEDSEYLAYFVVE